VGLANAISAQSKQTMGFLESKDYIFAEYGFDHNKQFEIIDLKECWMLSWLVSWTSQ